MNEMVRVKEIFIKELKYVSAWEIAWYERNGYDTHIDRVNKVLIITTGQL